MSSEFNDIERMFAEGLQNFEVTPPAHVWANIQKAKRKGILYYFANNKLKTAAVLLLLLASSALLYYSGAEKISSNQQSIVQAPEILEPSISVEKLSPQIKSSEVSITAANKTVQTNNKSKIAKKSSKSLLQKPLKKFFAKVKTEETTSKNFEALNNESFDANDLFMNMNSKNRIHLKYLIYPALSQYVYSTKINVKKPYKPVIKDKNEDQNNMYSKFSLEILGGPSLAFRKLSGTNHDLRNESEKAAISTQTGIKFSYHLNPNWSLQSGFMVENRSEHVKYNRTEIHNKLVLTPHNVIIYHPVLPPRNVTITDSSYVDQNVDFKFNATNKYTSLNIPLLLGYNFTLGKFQYRISGGSLLNLYTFNAANNLVRKGNEIVLESYKEKSTIKTSYYGAFGMLFPISENCSFITELSYYHNTANRLKTESSIKQFNYGLNLSGGIKINITK